MSHNYGLISEVDAVVIEKTLDLILDSCQDRTINVTEIGIYAGQTGHGIKKYIESKGRGCYLTGVDNFKDGEIVGFFSYDNFLAGDSGEVAFKLNDSSQHLVFVDGCHCLVHAISDYFCYAPKVKVGGYLAFHDTGQHIKPFKDFQHGDKDNPDAYISVRKALQTIGLLEPFTNRNYKNVEGGIYDQWEIIFDEYDPSNEAGGVTVFKKGF